MDATLPDAHASRVRDIRGARLCLVVFIAQVAKRLAPQHPDPESNDGEKVYDVAKLIGGMLALFMVFVLTQCLAYYRAAEIAVAKEASDVLQLDRAVAGVAPAYGDGPAPLS